MRDTEEKKQNPLAAFYRKHPILSNVVFIMATALILVWFLLGPFLSMLTHHGENAIVPDVKGMQLNNAVSVLADGGFSVELDSIYTSQRQPGIVIEQSPVGQAKVKEGRTVYLTYSCYSSKLVRVPMYYNMSRRQAMSAFEEAGFRNLTVKEIPSEHENLVFSAKYNGLILQPNKEIPVDARIVLEVGARQDDEVIDEIFIDDLDSAGSTDSVAAVIQSIEERFTNGDPDTE